MSLNFGNAMYQTNELFQRSSAMRTDFKNK